MEETRTAPDRSGAPPELTMSDPTMSDPTMSDPTMTDPTMSDRPSEALTRQRWDREEWVGEMPAGTDGLGRDARLEADRASDSTRQWNKREVVGEGQGSIVPPNVDEPLPEGESELSGHAHNPGVQHWASTDDELR